jgi:phage-related protein
MKRRTLLMFSITSTFLFIMLPQIPAINYTKTKEQIFHTIADNFIKDDAPITAKNDRDEINSEIITKMTVLLEKINTVLTNGKTEITDMPILKSLINLILSIIIIIINLLITVISIVSGLVNTIFSVAVNFLVGLLKKILNLGSLIQKVLDVFASIVTGLFGIVLNIIVGLLEVIKDIIVSIISPNNTIV